MSSWLCAARKRFHEQCLSGPITQTRGVPSIADISNKASREISIALLQLIGSSQTLNEKPAGQTAGQLFENVCRDFLQECLEKFNHLRPGRFEVSRGQPISAFAQYAHLDTLRMLAGENRALKTHLGSDYLIKPDIVVTRMAETEALINDGHELLVDPSIAQYSPLRQINGAGVTLHASVSCKLTIRSDRVQNTRSEALNLVRNRKGRLPHIVAITAEPLPSRIAAIALGTGDMDCIYHFALPELMGALTELAHPGLELIETMIEGQRLRDIADLPLDLMI